ncbi:MAG: hypothetical protein EXQ52_07460 [Bryobacterales bacterium]|nr:hypothetical protein [Bryobacterales bacterium]
MFNDGGAISGSFVYDADTNAYSSIDVTTTDGSIRSGAHYTLHNPCCADDPTFLLFVTGVGGSLAGTPVLSAFLFAPMTNAGGTIGLDPAGAYHSEESCDFADCGGPAPPQRDVVSGSVTASTVPEPGTFVLALPAFALIASRRKWLSNRFGSR